MDWINKNDILKGCRFCEPPDKERIIFETDNFYVMLSLGAMVEGYLLINSKTHIDCCGDFDEHKGKEFDKLYEYVRNVLLDCYGGCTFFEHGRAGSCLQFSEASPHCYHAHLHCVPIAFNMTDMIDHDFEKICLSSLEEFRDQYYIKPSPYLFVDDGSKNMFYLNKPIRKQYLRYLAASNLVQKDSWDWIKYPNYHNIENASLKLRPYFHKETFINEK